MFDSRLLLGGRRAVSHPTSLRRLSLLTAAVVSTLLLLVFWNNTGRARRIVLDTLQSTGILDGRPLCRQLPGADEVVVILKTGANEIEKLDVHLRTTTKCYPNFAIFSDYEEYLPSGQHLFDTFKYTSSEIKENHPDFALWRDLQDEGRHAILPFELSGTDSREKEESIRYEIPGWRLDKWKFLPMLNQTFHLYPDKHWYVFVEADTSLLWSNLLPYLSERSWADDHFIGSPVFVDNVVFAHGGTGFVLSRSALEKVVAMLNEEGMLAFWEAYTEKYDIGDRILGGALDRAGIPLTEDSPTWQGLPLGLLDLRPKDGLWCTTALTFHHARPEEIEEIWNFEQTRILESHEQTGRRGPELLRHRDLLEQYVLPRIQHPRSSWDNKLRATDETLHDVRNFATKSLEDCEARCEEQAGCMQYTLDELGNCRTTEQVTYGEAAEGIESGWMLGRIEDMLDTNVKC